MELKQTIGWFLIALGVGLLLWGLWSSFQVFTGKTAAPEIFTLEQAQTPKTSVSGSSDIQVQAQEFLNQTFKEQLKGFLPEDSMPKLFNLLSWSVFASIIIWSGGQIAGIGTRLL